MAASVRVRIITLFWLYIKHVFAMPTAYEHSARNSPLLLRSSVTFNNASGTIQVFNPITMQQIPQGPATDGSGVAFSIAAILWIGFCFFFGLPLAFAGIRGWRLTTGMGVGLAASVTSWAAIINSISASGVDDLVITALVFGFFVLAFVFGVFEFARLAGVSLLGMAGGMALGIRITLLKQGLLLNGQTLYAIDWVIIGVLGAAGGLVMIWRQRFGITMSSASAGTFLTFLGVDLIMNKQSGMSRGLRFLFDRNASHLSDIFTNNYTPPLSTVILIVVSLALTPILSYAQHRAFPHPFSRLPPEGVDLDSLNLGHEGSIMLQAGSGHTGIVYRMWDAASSRATLRGKSRFSL